MYLVKMAADPSLPVLAEMVVLDLLIVLDRLECGFYSALLSLSTTAQILVRTIVTVYDQADAMDE